LSKYGCEFSMLSHDFRMLESLAQRTIELVGVGKLAALGQGNRLDLRFSNT